MRALGGPMLRRRNAQSPEKCGPLGGKTLRVNALVLSAMSEPLRRDASAVYRERVTINAAYGFGLSHSS